MELSELQLANRVRWVRALLSGDFEQAKSYFKLFRNGHTSYCCLGVACELVDPDDDRLRIMPGHETAIGIMMSDAFAHGHYGMSNSDQETAMNWNDGFKLSFTRIADLVADVSERRIPFNMVGADSVPVGYAVEWLKQFSE